MSISIESVYNMHKCHIKIIYIIYNQLQMSHEDIYYQSDNYFNKWLVMSEKNVFTYAYISVSVLVKEL